MFVLHFCKLSLCCVNMYLFSLCVYSCSVCIMSSTSLLCNYLYRICIMCMFIVLCTYMWGHVLCSVMCVHVKESTQLLPEVLAPHPSEGM